MTDLRIPASQLLAQFGEQHVVAFFLVLARVSPLFILAPLFSSKMVPGRVRGIIAVALSVGLSPVVAGGKVLPTDPGLLGALLAKELLIGGAFAFILAAFFAALQVAGSLLDTLVGFSYGGLVDPITGNQSAVLSTAYALIGALIFIAIGGDGWVIQGVARTYDIVGLTQFPALGSLMSGASDAFVGIFAAAVQVAGPVILALILTDAAFGVVSRVVPNLNVFQVAMPAKVLVGLMLIGATLPFLSGWLANELQQDLGAALSSLRIG